MNLGKGKFLAVVLGVITFLIAAIFVVNMLPSSNDESQSTTVTPVYTPAPISPDDVTAANDPNRQQSVVEMATGEKYDGMPYTVTKKDVEGMISKLMAYDTGKETRKQWEKTQDSLVAYMPQDFPREMVMMFAPSAADWNSSGAREYIVGSVEKTGSMQAQGQFASVWEVNGIQRGFDSGGKLIDKFDQKVFVTVQCANKDKKSCMVLSYEAQTPLIQNLY